jgi:hypothetical protein
MALYNASNPSQLQNDDRLRRTAFIVRDLDRAQRALERAESNRLAVEEVGSVISLVFSASLVWFELFHFPFPVEAESHLYKV